MSKTVNTVTGPILAEQLGTTLMHEHIQWAYSGFQGDSRYWDNEDYRVETAVKDLLPVKAMGVDTIVDATPSDSSRDPLFLKKVSEATGINIICSTGYYVEGQAGEAYWKWAAGLGCDMKQEMYDLFEYEITHGIGNTGIKPGVIKLGSGEVFGEIEKAMFEQAGRISAKYNFPIITHTQKGLLGIEQADLLLAQGADPKRIMIGHLCDTTDMAYLMNIADKGCYLGFDRWGMEGTWSSATDKVRISIFVGLIKTGYCDRLMISQDHTSVWRAMGAPSDGLSKWNKLRFIKDIVPELKKSGVTDEEIHQILVDNPRRFFSY